MFGLKKSHIHNRIPQILPGVCLLLLTVFLLATAVGNGILTSIALEQPVCCGMEEHLHTEACYWDDLLICGKKAHTHSEHCYLVLLEDNNVNYLLSEVSRDAERSLTGVIEGAVAQGLRCQTETGGSHSDSAPSGTAPPTSSDRVAPALTAPKVEQLAALNAALQEDGAPAVVLNERLTASAVYAAPLREQDTVSTPEAVPSGDGAKAGKAEPVADSGPTALQADTLTLTYDLNWPSDYQLRQIDINNYTKPTIMGQNNTWSHTLAQGETETLPAPSATEVTANFPLQSDDRSRPGVVCFRGWQVGSGTNQRILSPGEVYTYSQLADYAKNGTVTLTAIWESIKKTSINFFVKWNSINDGNTSAGNYTPVLYVSEYAKNRIDITTGTVTDLDKDGDRDEYDVDLAIRAKAANGDLSSFPTDEYVFGMLENYADSLSVDGIAVKSEELNEHGYTILWYSLQANEDGNYHIDGKLVRKVGGIRVKKTFAGNAEAISAVKSGSYSISASAANSSKALTLNLSKYSSANPGGYRTFNEATNTYTWEIPNVAYGEQWTLTEQNHTATVNGTTVTPYMEYTVTDVLGSKSTHGMYTGSVPVTGQTYDQTVADGQMLTVSFRNIYPGTDSFILKKEDADTGNALSGAVFAFEQNGAPLRFNYADGIYTVAENGSVTELRCDSGFAEIKVKGLDFSNGKTVTVREITVPEGYASLANTVTLVKTGDVIQVSDSDSGARMTGGVLIVGNTAHTTDVTVRKVWNNVADARAVTVNLLANGEPVTALFPKRQDLSASAVLTAENKYTCTWRKLPAYADGKQIEWSVAETRIGDERANGDGSFDNWTVVYSAEAAEQAVQLTVTNVKKAGNTLTLHKTGANGAALPGAEFQLELLNSDGSVSEDLASQSGSTNEQGLLSFTGLPYGSYQLTETRTPTGYLDGAPIRFTVNTNGSITVTEGADRAAASGLVLHVKNQPGQPLPDTGGPGAEPYIRGGLALMLAAGCLLLRDLKKRGKEKREVS